MATETQTSSQVRNYAVGRYLSTASAAAFDITCGFKPRYVKIINLADRITIEFFEGMDDTYGIRTIEDGSRSIIEEKGITILDDGFTVGIDSLLNVQSKQLSWVAIG